MTIQGLYRLGEGPLSDKINQISAAITANPTRYSLTAPIATELATVAELYNDSLIAQEAARAAFAAAVQEKLAQHEAALSLFSQYLNVIYSAPTVSDADIASLGMSPRSTTRTPVTPVEPLNLIATPTPAGTVTLEWDRNGNPYSVNFVIESKTAETDWEIVEMTTKSKITLYNYVPGQTAWFRAYAQKNNENSVPSNVAVIYEGGEFLNVQIAA
ncbi:MAG TPA: fibronectin type III domain-containing protein [Fimbriimonadaceae bacterium]|nr:fibronectin type III domain-containing protein [Fimbriimonadaceae bacterium]